MGTWATAGGQQGSNLERVIIEVIWEDPTAATSSIAVAVVFYVECTYATNDDQVLTISGSGIGGGSPIGFRAVQGRVQVARIELGQQGLSYSGGPVYSWGASVSGHYQGSTPSHGVSWSLPARPASVPGAPNTGVDSITSSSARIVIGGSATNGSAIIEYQGQVSSVSSFSSNQTWNGSASNANSIRTLSNPAQTYYYRGRSRNDVGWGPWSATKTFKTLAEVPAQMALPTITNIGPDTATVNYVAPDNGGSAITGYQVQIATNSGFTTGVRVFTNGSLTGLDPGQTYYVRVRATNSAGSGDWSNVASFTTLSGGKRWTGTAWQDVSASYWTGSAWKSLIVYKRNTANTEWTT